MRDRNNSRRNRHYYPESEDNPRNNSDSRNSFDSRDSYNSRDRRTPEDIHGRRTIVDPIDQHPDDEPRHKKNLPGFLHFDQGSMSAIKIICMIVIGVLALMLVVKLGMIVVSGFGPFVDAASAVLDMIFNRFMSAVIGGVVIYVLIMAFGSHFIPPSIRRKLLPILIACLLLYSVAPALGTAVGELVIIVIGIMIAISVIIR